LTSPTFETFGFAEPLARALTQVGYTTPTPIQVQAMPPQLEGRDLLGLAETGSGKTATFVLPLLQDIAAKPVELGWKQVHTLILAPTRELAVQIDLEVASLARNMNIRRAVILGGVSKGPQINALKRGVHVCVATPGRLLDHVNMRSCDLSGVHTLVLDEADRMFDMGFIRDIKKIVSLIPMKRRTALFSATMPAEIRKFAYEILQDPFRVDLSTKTMVVDRIDQKVMVVRSAEKQSRLHTILADPACERVIVFTRTKRGADRVAERLGMAGINSAAFHGNKAQNARQRALNDFMAGHTRVLVATDIAARGIDVNNITHVINFDMPLDPETYVHRVGRTARKGTSGIAISLCDPSERAEIKAIERLMKQTIEVIGDVGGEHLPMPEKRPHHAHEAPRREGAHRKGPPRGDRKPFGDRAPREGDREGGRDFGRGASRGDSDRAPRRSFDRNDDAPRAPRTVEAGGFNPAAELHRPDTDRPADRPARSERPARGDRPERSSDKPREFKARDGGARDGAGRDDRPRSDKPRFDKPRDGAPSERPRSEGFKADGGRGEGRPFEARGPKPEWKRDGDKPRSDRPRPDAQRSDKPRHEGPRSDGPRSNGPRSDGPRHERPRFDGPRPERTADRNERPARADRPHSEARGPRPEWKRDGEKPRHDGPRSDKPRHEGARSDAPRSNGPRADKPFHGKPHTGGAPHRAGAKPTGERNWDGQKPPKFLKQRDGGRPTNRKPAA
jgi:ATP-dependent RNA helicase RhlE